MFVGRLIAEEIDLTTQTALFGTGHVRYLACARACKQLWSSDGLIRGHIEIDDGSYSKKLIWALRNCQYCWICSPMHFQKSIDTLLRVVTRLETLACLKKIKRKRGNILLQYHVEVFRNKTLPEAQRTQSIESITWIFFLTEINMK